MAPAGSVSVVRGVGVNLGDAHVPVADPQPLESCSSLLSRHPSLAFIYLFIFNFLLNTFLISSPNPVELPLVSISSSPCAGLSVLPEGLPGGGAARSALLHPHPEALQTWAP